MNVNQASHQSFSQRKFLIVLLFFFRTVRVRWQNLPVDWFVELGTTFTDVNPPLWTNHSLSVSSHALSFARSSSVFAWENKWKSYFYSRNNGRVKFTFFLFNQNNILKWVKSHYVSPMWYRKLSFRNSGKVTGETQTRFRKDKSKN